jgi:hypothetical protein
MLKYDNSKEGQNAPKPEYVINRVEAYPSIQDQLDTLYWDQVNGTSEFAISIGLIKDEFPKPAEEVQPAADYED